MHAVQFSYDVAADCTNNYFTLMESTATWATEYVYHKGVDNWEHAYADDFLSKPDDVTKKPLDWRGSPLHPYEAYLFPLYLQLTLGAEVIPSLWDATTGKSDELEAIQQALSEHDTDFDKAWPDFAIYNWNREPEVLSVVFFNGLTHKISVKEAVPDLGSSFVAKGLSDSEIEGANVWVLIKIGGKWREEPVDLTDTPWISFCRDSVAERLNEMVLIFSNSEHKKDQPNFTSLTERGSEPPLLWLSNIGCWQWKGSLNLTHTVRDGVTETLSLNDLLFENAMSGGTQGSPPTLSLPPSISLARVIDPGEEIPYPPGYVYKIKEGTASWEISGMWSDGDDKCTYSGAKFFPITGEIPLLTTNNWIPAGTGHRGILLPGILGNAATVALPVTEMCTDEDGTHQYEYDTYPSNLDIEVDPADNPDVKINDSGTAVQGDEKQSADPEDTTATWKLNAIREP